MKKKITHPDGRIEEVEGTPEELAQLEKATSKKSKKAESKQPSRRILNEEVARLTKELEAAKAKIQKLELQLFREMSKPIRTFPNIPEPYDYPIDPIVPWIVRPKIHWLDGTGNNIKFTLDNKTIC